MIKHLLSAALFILFIANSSAQGISHSNDYNEIFNNATDDYNNKRYDLAIAKYSSILKDHPEHITYFRRSYCYFYTGQYNNALLDIEKAFELCPKDHRYFYLKAQSYDKLKKYDLASYYLDLAIAFEPEKLYYYKYRSAMNLDIGNYKKAEYDFNVLIGANPADYKSYYGRGMAKFNQKKKTEACMDWNYAKDHHKGSNRFFFYKCTDVDLRNMSLKKSYNQLCIPPQLASGEDLSEYFSNHVGYNLETYKKGYKGAVLAKFVITKDLQVTNIEIVSSSNKNFNPLVTKAIQKSTSDWSNPAMLNGIPVDYTIYLPVIFKLTELECSITDLMDSVKIYRSQKNYMKLYATTNEILFSNPFMIEAINAKQIAIKNIKSASMNMQALRPKTRKAEVLNEIWANHNYTTTYYNNKWQVTKAPYKTYYRICEWEGPNFIKNGQFTDYTLSNNALISGNYANDQKHGDFSYYYDSGTVQSSYTFTNNQLSDSVKYFFPNGSPHQIIKIVDSSFDVVAYYDEQGNNLLHGGDGSWEFEKIDHDTQTKLKVMGNFKEYKRTGDWICFLNDDIVLEEKYKNGKLINCLYYERGKSQSQAQKIDSSQIKNWIFTPNCLIKSEHLDFSKEYIEEFNNKN